MTRAIVITSGTAGVGRTSISVNAAIELARHNQRVCLFDADPGSAKIKALLGIDAPYSLDDCLSGERSLAEVLFPTRHGIDVLAGPAGIDKAAGLPSEKIRFLVATLSRMTGYQYFLIDAASSLSGGALPLMLAGNETLLVITAEAPSLTEGYGLLKIMARNHYRGSVRILVNRSQDIAQGKETYRRFKQVVDRHLDLAIIPGGIILEDRQLARADETREPLLHLRPDAPASRCIRVMVANLLHRSSDDRPGYNFADYWQRYWEFTLLDRTRLNNTGIERNHARVYCPIDLPKKGREKPATMLPESPRKVGRAGPKPLFAKPGPLSATGPANFFDPAGLLTPLPLLAAAQDLQVRGRMTEEALLALVTSDPALLAAALHLLGIGSKSKARRAPRITTRHQLAREVGEPALSSLLRAACLRAAMRQVLPPGFTEWLKSFWHHSYRCGILAEMIAEITAYPFPEEAYLAGILHDIGRLLLQTAAPESYASFAELFDHEEPLLRWEVEQFGADHATIGASALGSWNLNSFLADAVRYHNEPRLTIGTAFDLAKIVCLARVLDGAPPPNPRTEQLGRELYDLTASQLHNLLVVADDRIRRDGARWRLDFGQPLDAQESGARRKQFRLQAADYALLQQALPPCGAPATLPQAIAAIFQACGILFGMQPELCLLPDRHHLVLKARGLPDSYGGEPLGDIEFSLQWQQSLVVASFLSGELLAATDREGDSRLGPADLQLLESLGAEGLVCLPMTTDGRNLGLLIFGIGREQLDRIPALQARLELFGVQAARNMGYLTGR